MKTRKMRSALFPFVAIRTIGQEKQSGTLKLTQQLPVSLAVLLVLKVLAVGLAWCLFLVPALTAVLIWSILGGHLSGWELANLLLGHALYAFAVTGIAGFAAAVADAVATAAIIALACTLGFWVLDFAANSAPPGLLQQMAQLSLTAALRSFERGLFSLPDLLRLVQIGVGLLVAAGVWLPSGAPGRRKLVSSAVLVAVLTAALATAGQLSFSRDVSEDRRNSFNPLQGAIPRSLLRDRSVSFSF